MHIEFRFRNFLIVYFITILGKSKNDLINFDLVPNID